jgi:hypothetical protein
MAAIRIRKTIDSETLTLPELKPFIGQTVEIVIEKQGDVPDGFVPGTGDWDSLLAAAQNLVDCDYQAQFDQDACDIRNQEERLK